MQPYRFFLVAMFLLSTPLASAQDAATAPPIPTLEQVREAMKSQFPAPPDGFSWHLFKNVVFLKPQGWQDAEVADRIVAVPRSMYATSPEAFSATKQFETGFTIEFMSGSQRLMKAQASTMALALLKPLLDTHKKEEILIFEQGTQGDFVTTFFRYRDAPPGLKPIIVHKFILANNVTDSFNVFSFESPAETWEENWTKYGTPIIGKLSVLPGVPTE